MEKLAESQIHLDHHIKENTEIKSQLKDSAKTSLNELKKAKAKQEALKKEREISVDRSVAEAITAQTESFEAELALIRAQHEDDTAGLKRDLSVEVSRRSAAEKEIGKPL